MCQLLCDGPCDTYTPRAPHAERKDPIAPKAPQFQRDQASHSRSQTDSILRRDAHVAARAASQVPQSSNPPQAERFGGWPRGSWRAAQSLTT